MKKFFVLLAKELAQKLVWPAFIFLTVFVVKMLCLGATAMLASTTPPPMPNEVSGKSLSPYVRAAIKQLGKNLPSEQVSEDQVVVVASMDQFFKDHGVTDPDTQAIYRESQAFVWENKFPVYVNADHPKYQKVDRVFTQLTAEQSEPIVTALAAALRHEASHARGEQDEVVAYGLEIQYLQNMKKKGHFQSPGADQYIADVVAFRDAIKNGLEANGVKMVKMAVAPQQAQVASK